MVYGRRGRAMGWSVGLSVMVAVLLLGPPVAQAHRAPLDDRGCHRNNQAGWYHCHEGELKGRRFANSTGAQRALKKLHAKRIAAAIAGPVPMVQMAEPLTGGSGSHTGQPVLSPHAGVYGPYQAAVQQVLAGGVLVVEVAIWPGLRQRTLVRLGGLHLPRANPLTDCEERAGEQAKQFVEGWLNGAEVQLSAVEAARDGYGMTARLARAGKDLSQALIDAGLATRPAEEAPANWCR